MKILEKIKLKSIDMLALLTLSRIPLTILFIITFNKSSLLASLIILFFIILSDFIDGKIARKFNINSKAGSILDPYCDLFFVLSTSIFFNLNNLIPISYTLILIFKFVEFNITSYYAGMSSKKIPFMFDSIGRVITALYQGVPFIVLIPALYYYHNIYILFLVIGTLISSLLRIYNLIHNKSNKKHA